MTDVTPDEREALRRLSRVVRGYVLVKGVPTATVRVEDLKDVLELVRRATGEGFL